MQNFQTIDVVFMMHDGNTVGIALGTTSTNNYFELSLN